MNEDFVSFSLAKKLKEKGFRYDKYNLLDRLCMENQINHPSISQVLKWLRGDKVISVEPYASASGWRVTICRAYHQDRCDAGGGTCLKREVIGYNDGGAFEKYEEAAIAGIEYVIDNLI